MSSFIALMIGIILIGTLLLLIIERIHKTLGSLLGAGLALFFAIIPGSAGGDDVLIHNVDHLAELLELDLLLVIIGITLMVGVAQTTGLFEYIAIKVLKKTGDNQYKLLLALSLLTMIFSALLNAYMALIIVGSVTIVSCDILDLNPKPFIIAEAIFSNLGGTMTLVASPPNLIVGGHFNVDFVTFFILTAPYVLVASIVTIVVWNRMFKKELSKEISRTKFNEVMLIDERELISDPKKFNIAVIILLLTILGFILSAYLPFKLELGYIAIAGGFAMVGFVDNDVEEGLKKIEWSLVFFLVGLLALIGIAETAGILEVISGPIEGLFEINLLGGTIILAWINSIASGILDNVPVATIMTGLMDHLLISNPDIPFYPLLVSVVIGTNLGGNITPIGSASTVQAVVILERVEKKEAHITFIEFVKLGGLVTFFQLLIGSVYILVLWLIFI